MSGLTLIGDSTTLDVKVGIGTLSNSPEDQITKEDSINAQRRKHEGFSKDVLTFETTHYSDAEVNELEDFLRDNDNIVEAEGIVEGTFDVIIEDSKYQVFNRNGTLHVAGQILTIRMTEESIKDKYNSGGGV